MPLVAIAMLAIAIIVDGAPFFGSDVGGVLSMVPAYAVTATLLLGWRIRWKLIAIYGAATIGLVGIFAAIDLSRPADKRTHLGRLITSGQGKGGSHNVSVILQRKLSENTSVLFGSVWTIMLPVVLAGIAYLIYRTPGRMRGLHERIPQLSAALVGFVDRGGARYCAQRLGNRDRGRDAWRDDAGARDRHDPRRPRPPRWAISPNANPIRRTPVRPIRPISRMPRPRLTPHRHRVIVILGLLVGLLTVRLLVLGGRDMLEAPVLQRRNFHDRAVPTAAGLFVVIAALRHRSRARHARRVAASVINPV